MSRASLRDYLRAGTSEFHASLDAKVAARAYLRSRAGYCDFLQRSLAFHAAAERALDLLGLETWLADWPVRRRAELIRDDLRRLATTLATENHSADVALVAELLTGEPTRERAFGIAYVLEGSTLGAAYVLRELAPLGITAANGASFLAGGKLPERRWPSFLEVLEAQEQTAFDREAALAAARAAFSAASREFG